VRISSKGNYLPRAKKRFEISKDPQALLAAKRRVAATWDLQDQRGEIGSHRKGCRGKNGGGIPSTRKKRKLLVNRELGSLRRVSMSFRKIPRRKSGPLEIGYGEKPNWGRQPKGRTSLWVGDNVSNTKKE